MLAAFMVSMTGQSGPPWPSLREALRRNDVTDVRQLPQALLDAGAAGVAVDDDDREAFVAFFTADAALHVARLDRASSRWRHATVSIDDAAGTGNSLLDIKRTRRFIYLDTHINPSAGRLIVLSRDLKLRRALYGWRLVMLPDETVVYHHSEIHFAPTHSLEISVFNAATLKQKQIYPPKPYQPVRKAFIDRVAQGYRARGEEWFRLNNHHMDAEQFDSSLDGVVVYDAAMKSISFGVVFSDPGNGNDTPPFSEHVVVTCGPTDLIDRLECRERAR